MRRRRQNQLLRRCLLFLGCLLSCATLAQAQPALLDDTVLHMITAGATETGDSGGVIVGNSSKALINQTSAVVLSDETQAEARVLNLVNSADSTVANGVNVWDGEGSASSSSPLQVSQLNHIEQNQRRSASLSDYHRDEAEWRVFEQNSGSQSHAAQGSYTSSVMDLERTEQVSHTDSTAEVNTRLKMSIGDSDTGVFDLEANIGQGVAVAGHLDAHYDGGSAEFALVAGGGISASADIGGTDEHDLIILGANLGNTGVSAGITAEATFSLYANIELPEMDLELHGGGCGVVMGSCSSTGTSEETITEISDHSTLDIMEESTQGSSTYTSIQEEEYRSPFSLGQAQAEYIVVDNSSLTMNSNFTLELSGSAQRQVRAMNVVNAIGSSVTNAVNIARSSQMSGNGELVLRQTNIITHSR